jgi:hypothetical protein
LGNNKLSKKIIIILTERWEGVNWICVAQDRNKWRACESGNEISVSIKCGKFLGWLMYYYIFKKDSASWC